MDVGQLREAFPELLLSGGIAKGALRRDAAEIASELQRRFRVAWDRGRYTPALDYGAPPDIPWANLVEYAARYKVWAMDPSGKPLNGSASGTASPAG